MICLSQRMLSTQHNKNKRWTSMPSVGFEPTVPEIKLQQTYTFVCMATEISIVDVQLHLLLTLAKNGLSGQLHAATTLRLGTLMFEEVFMSVSNPSLPLLQNSVWCTVQCFYRFHGSTGELRGWFPLEPRQSIKKILFQRFTDCCN